ncbi:Inner membrane protein YrbG [Planctomycetes bacterium Pan216]|uniref:Inner membrane protein YrbG n=1 Tax=Kolteria novifilia TaxID=2527975 RepID=A0A518B1Q8_9BACT|nr:Inner membrane protein YrbG [Planctomycetes bacterium Pan216]
MVSWLLAILEIVGGIAGLMYGGEVLVRSAARLARTLGVTPMVIGLTIVAIGTSLPELVVSVYAALQDVTDVTVGNAVGSNLFNLLAALGIVAMVRPVISTAVFIDREIPIMIAVMVISWLFCLPGILYRPLAIVLLLLLAGYLALAVHWARKEREPLVEKEFDEEIPDEKAPILLDVALMVGGFLLMVVGSHFFLEGAVWIARTLGISELIIGLTLVAFGTSAPELFTCVIAVMRDRPDLALGNLVGSCIFNMLGILGCAGVVSDLAISTVILQRDFPLMCFTGLLTWFFVRTHHRVSRLEGGILFAIYIGYIAYLIYATATGAAPTGG